eukprot:7380949-Prymnesium_polylepis.1
MPAVRSHVVGGGVCNACTCTSVSAVSRAHSRSDVRSLATATTAAHAPVLSFEASPVALDAPPLSTSSFSAAASATSSRPHSVAYRWRGGCARTMPRSSRVLNPSS